MPVDPNTLAEFDGKQVILHRIQEDGSAEELEGKIEAASPAGIAFKEKGRRDVDLVMPDEIDNIELAPEKPKTIVQKKLKPVTINNVRQHLVDRHGFARSQANGLSDDDAYEIHEAIDHSDLGHKHVAEEEEEESGTEE